jgi:oligopeptide/dipeptide ABC transporter ATP-binding protein
VTPILELRDLTVGHRGGAVRAVAGVSLSVAAGEVVGLTGESGCGKSSLAHAVLRLLPPDTLVGGRILLAGEDVAAMSWGRLRAVRWATAALVPQDAQHALNPVRTVGEQIAGPVRLHERCGRRAARARAAELLERVGLPAGRASAVPAELSGGERQRVLLAAALACSPRLLIADEATTGVDPATRAGLLRVLAETVTGTGAGLLMISHDLSLLAGTSDRLAVMYAGRIVEQGPTAEVVDRPRHPYTAALVASSGGPGDAAARRRPRWLPGDPPDPALAVPGCAFRPRCGAALPSCADRTPVLAPDGPGREVACLNAGAGGTSVTGPPAAPATPTPPSTPTTPSAPTSPVGPAVLGARAVTVRVGGRGGGTTILDGVDLDLRAGEVLALVGRTGAGKTTLARALAGLARPVAGHVLLDDAPVATRGGRRRLRHAVRYLPQDPAGTLNPAHTVGRAVGEALRIHGLPGGAAAVAGVLHRVGLRPADRFLPRLPAELSGGQRARVALAAALVTEPRVLIADEPTAGLDAAVRGEVLHVLLRLAAGEPERAVLLVTHDRAAAWQVADRVAVLDRGRVVGTGPAERALPHAAGITG